uniref:Antistasin-like domain-containing protein n=1 Tax=Strigamia maritima TaxID=126957 RepID=T1IKF1_STRMM
MKLPLLVYTAFCIAIGETKCPDNDNCYKILNAADPNCCNQKPMFNPCSVKSRVQCSNVPVTAFLPSTVSPNVTNATATRKILRTTHKDACEANEECKLQGRPKCPLEKTCPKNCLPYVDQNGCKNCHCCNACVNTICPEEDKLLFDRRVLYSSTSKQFQLLQPKKISNPCTPATCGDEQQCVLHQSSVFDRTKCTDEYFPLEPKCKEPCPQRKCAPYCIPTIGTDNCSSCYCEQNSTFLSPCLKKCACKSNEECVLQDVTCLKAPCYPIKQCRPKCDPEEVCPKNCLSYVDKNG